MPRLSRFAEINVRTYVTVDGKPGIYFLSLDAGSWAAVRAARLAYRLPYFRSRISTDEDDGVIGMRRSASPPTARRCPSARPTARRGGRCQSAKARSSAGSPSATASIPSTNGGGSSAPTSTIPLGRCSRHAPRSSATRWPSPSGSSSRQNPCCTFRADRTSSSGRCRGPLAQDGVPPLPRLLGMDAPKDLHLPSCRAVPKLVCPVRGHEIGHACIVDLFQISPQRWSL